MTTTAQSADSQSSGPLKHLKVIEMGGLGPTPFCAMMLADLGADVVRVDRQVPDRAESKGKRRSDFLGRGRRSIALDLKSPQGVAALQELVQQADVLLEGFRPGVMERLGLGPDELLRTRPELIYGRMTGWGQSGPLAQSPGHDINYIGLSGALDVIGRDGDAPVPPPTMLGDFGGGGMLLAMGVCAALVERGISGKGQVVDAAVVDGTSLLTTLLHSLRADGLWRDERGTNAFDTGAPFYEVYETADGKFVSIGAVEPKFYTELVNALGLEQEAMYPQYDRSAWPLRKKLVAEAIRSRTRSSWVERTDGLEACISPVLGLDEVAQHPHHQHRRSFTEVDGELQPAPAPRFSRTPARTPTSSPLPGQHTREILQAWNVSPSVIQSLADSEQPE